MLHCVFNVWSFWLYVDPTGVITKTIPMMGEKCFRQDRNVVKTKNNPFRAHTHILAVLFVWHLFLKVTTKVVIGYAFTFF